MTSTPVAVVTIAGWLVGIWGASFAVGGTSTVPPHAFYFPILFAAVRFGAPGAAATAVVASLLAGPLLPADVASGETQPLSDWLTRSLFFVAIGQTFSVLGRSLVDEQRNEIVRIDDERELAAAIVGDELGVLYQPIVELDGTIIGVEALVRWHHPRHGVLTPDRFIPLAESSGLIARLDAWVLRTACHQVADWRADAIVGDASFRLDVNVSAQGLSGTGLHERVTAVLADTGLPAHWLHLEITETSLVHDLDRSVAALCSLKDTGIRLAIDDFGVGYGSLTYLDRFPVDVVKIDRSFVAALGPRSPSPSVAGAIVALADRLGLSVVAEGVETRDQARELERLGCRHAQGWLYGAPARADQLVDALRRQQHRSDEQRTASAV